MDRAQTGFDFAVGMGVFLLTVAFVLTFIPTIFQPFGVGSGSDEIVGDRIAATLSEDSLVVETDTPAILDRTCTERFFSPANNSSDGCQFTNDTLSATIGSTASNINVTIRSNDSIAKIDGTRLAIGDPPRSGADVTVSRRVVQIDGDSYELWVRVW